MADALSYLIVDDEPIAHQVIRAYADPLPFLRCKASCHDAPAALAALGDGDVDLLFLDVLMPGMGGFELLRTLRRPPLVIVTSAHRDFALEGYDLDICDYLLKPFSLERFLRAVNKARALAPGDAAPFEPERLFIKDGKKHRQVHVRDIAYIEACGNYCLVHAGDAKIVTQEKISELESRLPHGFLRIHKSYLVAKHQIQLIEAEELIVAGRRLPIGRVYKPKVQQLLAYPGPADPGSPTRP